MTFHFRIAGVSGALCAALLALLQAVAPAQAQVRPAPAPVKFTGQVTAVMGPSANPTGFTLQLRGRSLDFRLAPNAMLVPRSAEAEVAGFMAGDYAVVTARRVNKTWVAEEVDFDVQPVVKRPRVVTLSGTVLRVTPNGKHFQMRLDATGDFRWVAISAKTQFRVNGQLVFTPPPLARGDTVQVVMHPTVSGWVADEVNLRTGSGLFRF